MKRWILLVCAALAALPFLLVRGAEGTVPAATPAARTVEGEVHGLLLAVPFVLDEPWTHGWRLERPVFRAGWLVVLEVDPALVRPIESAQPVLCFGDQTLERLNHGFESGRVVAILPSALDAAGRLERTLVAEPFYFAAPALPESLAARALARELDRARERGREPFDAATVRAAQARGGETLVAANRTELDRLAAELILAHAPSERERAESMLLPAPK